MKVKSTNEMKTKITVRLKYLSVLRDKTHKREEEVELSEGSILADIASYLNEKYGIIIPDPQVMLILNGKGYSQYPEKLSIKLKDGDKILLLPPVSGG